MLTFFLLILQIKNTKPIKNFHPVLMASIFVL